jgi:hypothetical protein
VRDDGEHSGHTRALPPRVTGQVLGDVIHLSQSAGRGGRQVVHCTQGGNTCSFGARWQQSPRLCEGEAGSTCAGWGHTGPPLCPGA